MVSVIDCNIYLNIIRIIVLLSYFYEKLGNSSSL